MKRALLLFAIILFTVAGSQVKLFSQDNSEKLKLGIQSVYDMFNTGDFTNADKYISKDYIEHSAREGEKPGFQSTIDAITMLRKAFPDLKYTINDIIINDNKAAVLVTMTGTNTGDFMGMKATNKKISVLNIDWILFSNAQATEHWGYGDDMGMMMQLGMGPMK
jgi:predicted ester cyclase